MLPVTFLILLNYKIFRGIRCLKLNLRNTEMEFFVFLNILDISEVPSVFERIFVMKCNSKYEKAPFNYMLTKCSMLPSSKEVLLKKIALRD